MQNDQHYNKVKDFLRKNENWIKKEIPDCAYGVAGAKLRGGKLRVALRPREITPEVEVKINELREKAAAEGLELDVRPTGKVAAR